MEVRTMLSVRTVVFVTILIVTVVVGARFS